MPRYFFHTSDGESWRDRQGVELPDEAAARTEAVMLLGEILKDDPEKFVDHKVLRVLVMDTSDRSVFEIVASGSTAGKPPPA